MHDPVFLRRAWWSLLWLLPLPLIADASGLDVWLEGFYFDASRHAFPWRQVGWLDFLLHEGLRDVLILGLLLMTGLLLASCLLPAPLASRGVTQWRHPRLLAYLLVALLAGPLLVTLLRQFSAQPCPWSLALFGGRARYAGLLEGPVLQWHATGKCLPGAHASGGFALLAFVPVLAGRRRRLMLATALLLGLVMSWTRMMQGAHFLSHNLWSAWICWAATLLCFSLMRPLAAAPRDDPVNPS